MSDQAEIDALKAKIVARKGQPGLGENVAELEKRLAELEAENGS